MIQTSHKTTIENTYSSINDFCFKEKETILFSEKNINNLLDSILELKAFLTEKTNTINEIITQCEAITWFNDVATDKDALKRINDIIVQCINWHHKLIKLYVSLNYIRNKNIAIQEAKLFKQAIDDLKDTYTHLSLV